MTGIGKDRTEKVSLKNWGAPPVADNRHNMRRNVALDCGWGRLLFGQTFETAEHLATVLRNEKRGQRDGAPYVHEPHVLLSMAPDILFADPSYTYRLMLETEWKEELPKQRFSIRRAEATHEEEINRIYLTRGMVPLRTGYCRDMANLPEVIILVACDTAAPSTIYGVVMGVDHTRAINDPDNGSSLWALAIDPQAPHPGIGRALTRSLADIFRDYGRAFMDLSVMHDNTEAIALYEKLGFEQVPVYCLKKKNPINQDLFIGPLPDTGLNPYAQIIVNEARRRGILVEIEDSEAGLFQLTFGGRRIACRESLSDLTSAVALSRCDDKALTHRLLNRAGLNVPEQCEATSDDVADGFLAEHKSIVVKPARGEQGAGVAIDLKTTDEVREAVRAARALCDRVLLEKYVSGGDLRIIVIDSEVVAAAIRRPPKVTGDGKRTVRELIQAQSRRRQTATGGESQIPLDDETSRCVREAGFEFSDVLPEGKDVQVRNAANLHTGGTIHDVTDALNADLRDAAIKAAETLDIPVVGLDLIVDDPADSNYVIIEANERPGLANHEPQPTAERFIDLLFPQTRETGA